MKSKKTFALSFFSLLTSASLAVPGLTFAQTSATASNTNTQSGSYNVSTTTINTSTNVNNTNTASVTNLISQNANTGDNYVASVNGDVTVMTGGASLGATVVTDLNKNTTAISDPTGSISVATGNTNTQSDSTNFATGTVNSNTTANNSNSLSVANEVNQTANTGDNTIKDVTGNVGLSTGDAALSAAATTTGNQNKTIVTGAGGVGLSASNTNTQSDSYNDAVATANTNLTVNNSNDASVSNNFYQKANTGHNYIKEVNGNVMPASTGDVDLRAAAGTAVNYNTTMVGYSGGSFGAAASNQNTQSDSTNFVTAELNANGTVNNNNFLGASNYFSSYGNTGNGYHFGGGLEMLGFGGGNGYGYGFNGIRDINGNVGLSTGNVTSAGIAKVLGNVNETMMSGLGGSFGASSLNHNTQSDSYNQADTLLNMSLLVNNSNSAGVSNYFENCDNTGRMLLKEVNGNANLFTGMIRTGNEALTDLNRNTTMGDLGFGAITAGASNHNTQSDSMNYVSALLNLFTNANNSNDLGLSNLLSSNGNTGDNSARDINGMFMHHSGMLLDGFMVNTMGNTSYTNF